MGWTDVKLILIVFILLIAWNSAFGDDKTYISDYDVIDITDGATHYHADYVRPSWAKTKTKTIEIEDHIFYRWEK